MAKLPSSPQGRQPQPCGKPLAERARRSLAEAVDGIPDAADYGRLE